MEREHVGGGGNEFYAFGNRGRIGNLDGYFVDAVNLVVLEVDRGRFNPERRLFLNFIGFTTVFNGLDYYSNILEICKLQNFN